MNKYVSSHITKKIIFYRKKNGYSQVELSDLLGMSRVSISNIEAERQGLSVHNIYALACLFKIPVSALFPPIKRVTTSTTEKKIVTVVRKFKPIKI